MQGDTPDADRTVSVPDSASSSSSSDDAQGHPGQTVSGQRPVETAPGLRSLHAPAENGLDLREELEIKTATLRRLEHRLRALESMAKGQRRELEFIKHSTAWRLVQQFWGWNVYWFPFGSRRRRLYEATMGAVGRLISGQPRRFRIQEDEAQSRTSIRYGCEEPRSGEMYSGTVTISGFATAPTGITKIEVFIDGEYLGDASYGQLRPDIARRFPSGLRPQNSGFRLIWDASRTEDGVHEILLRFISGEGETVEEAIAIVLDKSLASYRYEAWIERNELKPAERVAAASK